MNSASLTTHLKRPESLWQWLCLISLICLGWVSLQQLEAMFAEAETDDGSLVVYDANGNAHVFLSDEAAGRHLPEPIVCMDAHECAVLDLALLKPSCCEAPEGLCHFWYRPNCIGVLPTNLPGHPGQGARAADPGSPRGPIP